MTAQVLNVPRPEWLDQEDVNIYEDAIRSFVEKECLPHTERWEKAGIVDREIWNKAGENGLLVPACPEEYGGAGGNWAHDYAFHMATCEAGIEGWGASLHNSIVAPYVWHYGTEEQKQRILPKLVSGEYVGAIAMSEPGAGSDLQGIKTTAVKDGNGYKINGSKTFITNGGTANFIIVVAKTDPTEGAKGTSLFLIETDGLEGFRRGRNLDKVGMKSQDTAELFFEDCRVPAENLIGPENGGFYCIMSNFQMERLILAVTANSTAQLALDECLRYVKEREAFGRPLAGFQVTRHKLAEMATDIRASTEFTYRVAARIAAGENCVLDVSMAKNVATRCADRVTYDAVQLFGGSGYMRGTIVERLYRDNRILSIGGGTHEIMNEVIAKQMGL